MIEIFKEKNENKYDGCFIFKHTLPTSKMYRKVCIVYA